MRLIKSLAILFLFNLICYNVNANVPPYEIEEDFKKSDPVQGYIVTLENKKIEGEIIAGSITDNEVKIIFISETNEKKKTYKAKELLGYGYESIEEDDLGLEYKRWIHYEQQKVDYPPKPFGSTTVFMQREESGALTLYCYYIEVRNNRKQPFRYHYYIKNDNNKLVKIEKDDFRKVANKVFKDYQAMNSKIGGKDFQYKNLDRMVRDYNFWVDNRHDPNEYRVALKQ